MPTPPKVLSHDQLLSLRSRASADARTVVHCHGCFDIVHPGHVHHLQYAKSLGDVLIVSVSSDSNVNKGTARPLIPDELRALNLAALECVDAVYVNPQPTAIELLESLRPDLYIKGSEYELSVDPRFIAERDTVIRNGGRVVYSSGDIVFSSSAIISQMTRTDPFEREKLQRLFDRYSLSAQSLGAGIDAFQDIRAVVIGDYIQDRYHFCEATGIAGEAPVMALRALESQSYDGGAAIVAHHLAARSSQIDCRSRA
jgi:rfaE bifunctional protein nucleotidyltransferase chain/domain